MKSKLLSAVLALAAASVTAPTLCRATPLDYTVSGTTVLNGNTETITGSFTFDAATNTESNVSITLSGGAAPLTGLTIRQPLPLLLPTKLLRHSALRKKLICSLRIL